MAASVTQNPASRPESKSAKKKKAKTEAVEVQKSAEPTAVIEKAPSNSAEESTNGDGTYESPYIKELYKNIRNVNKKITNASKVDNVLAENPGKSLDELVATRKINADQKAQILKKPSLQASLAQLEEQIAQYKKFDQEYKTKLQVEKAEFEKTFSERASTELEEKVNAAKESVAKEKAEEQEANLLLITKFLCLAALRRSPENDPNLDENKGIEGLLTQVYSGDEAAVAAMTKIIQGSEEICSSVNGEELTTTYADIKAIALALPTSSAAGEYIETADEETTQTEVAEYPVQSDPTIANAGLTEIDDPVTTAMTNGHQEPSFEEAQKLPQNSAFGEGGNAAAEANWDNNNDLSTSQEWVEVPREATETETGVTATPAAAPNTQSWADEQPESPGSKTPTAPATNNDGFHEVSRNRGRGEYRGRGGRGSRGFRGDGQHRGGRGRGGPRGAPRAPRGDSS
ncbi:38508c6e-d30e-4606-90aa-d807c8709e39 [Sclerotinia trifoliorum]|uniref:38508c6e-d30e-4606-90aa-d807c8709e39 n=1 Tax=Sclerotinia trifoliorum TaxID=28548 RepID=A0A8H2ZLT0_9HELO|nr:38508c6e-d30e-4606-90aa-d807c8709e39 [Sclerotinia trifoliorum]